MPLSRLFRFRVTGFPFFAACLAAAAGGLLVAGAAAPAWANWFGGEDPVPQWGLDAAKTPTPTYVGDAASVVLYDEYVETINAEGRATERERSAFRILQPQARDEFCSVDYDVDEKIDSFREWTIAANGQVFEAKSTDFADVGDQSGLPILLMTSRTRVVRPPAADVGATVICETEVRLPPYQQEEVWNIQASVPFVFEAFEVDLPPGRNYAADWHRYSPVKPVEVAPNHWRWELRNVKALDLRDVRSSPSWDALAARVYVHWGEAAVTGTANQWRALGLKWSTLEGRRPDPTPEITAETRQLIAGTTDFYSKLAAITSYIQKNIRYFVVERGIGGWQAHPAAEVFRNGYGDCKDKTTLLISMLGAAGIHAFYVPVDDRRGVVDPEAPSFYGDHMITAIEIPEGVNDPRLQAVVTAKDGKRYLIFDPTDERTPVGNLPSNEQGGYGLLVTGATSQVIELPVLAPDANVTTRTGQFQLGEDGTLTGSVKVSLTGPGGGDFRGFLKYTDPKERHDALEQAVGEDLPGVTLDSYKFTQPEDLAKPVEEQYSVTDQGYAHAAGNLLLVRARVVGEDDLAWNDKPRRVPIDLNATGSWRDSFDIALPAGYVVEELPDPVDLNAGFASYQSKTTLKTTAKGSVLHYEREYAVRKVEIPAAEAVAFRKFEGAIVEDQRAAVVLRKN